MPSNAVVKISTVKTPIASNDAFRTLEDSTSYLDVLANDGGGNAARLYGLSTLSGAASSAQLLAAPRLQSIITDRGATATIVTSGEHAGTISYDSDRFDHLAKNETVIDTFSYFIQLGNGALSVATVTVTVVGINDRPTVANVAVAGNVGEDGPPVGGTFAGDDIDSDDDAASLTYTLVSGPAGGTVTITGNTFSFDPGDAFQDLDTGEFRTVTFTYRATDRHGAVSDVATVTLVVAGSDDATSGAALDGYIADALVFRDNDGDGVWDHEAFTDVNGNGRFDAGDVDANNDGVLSGEAFVFTDATGQFTGLQGTGRIVLAPIVAANGTVVTHDISTGQAFTGTLAAAAGSTVVTPLTTLVDALVQALPGTPTAAQIVAAQAQVAAALGLGNIDLANYDPVAVIAGGGTAAEIAAALEVQKAAVQVANILAVITATLDAAGVDGAAALAAAALAGEIDGSPLALDDAAVIGAVIATAAAAVADPAGKAAVLAQAGSVSDALANVNALIADTPSTGDPLGALAAIVAAQIVAQGDLADDAAAAVDGGPPLDAGDYDGGALTDLIDAAVGEVNVIVPTDPGTTTLGAPERPTIDAGARVSAAEAADGVVVSVSYGSGTGAVAGDRLELKLGSTVIASFTLAAGNLPAAGATLSHDFVVAAATLGADGTKVLSAAFAGAAGAQGAPSSLLVVTLDTAAPDAPADLVSSDGPTVSVLEAANGTIISGTAEAGSLVTLTLTRGAASVVKQVEASGGVFSATVSAADLTILGEGYITYSATATDAAGNTGAASAAGQFRYSTQPLVDSDTRIDVGAAPSLIDDEDEGAVAVTPQAGGGFVVRWLVPETGVAPGDDIEVASAAFQRFGADGEKIGGPIVLTGIDAQADEDDEVAFGLTALENGHFVLALNVDQANGFRAYGGTVGANNGVANFSLVGEPETISIGAAPAGATYALVGASAANPATQLVVALPLPINGSIEVPQTVLDQFAFDNRLSLRVTNPTASAAAVNLNVQTEMDQKVDFDAPFVTSTFSNAAAPAVVVFGGAGRVESFDLNTYTAGANGLTFTLQVSASNPFDVDLSGIPGASLGGNSTIFVSGLTADANGVVAVPQLLLERLGPQDVRVFLQVNGLVAGNAFSATTSGRPFEPTSEGVYIQLFGPDGAALGPRSVKLDGSLPASDGEDAGIGVSPTVGGGFVVHWITVDGGFAVQRFGGDGQSLGAAVKLQSEVGDGLDDPSFDLTPLAGGGYALAVGVEHQEFYRNLFGTSNAGAPLTFSITGEPISISVQSAPAGAIYSLAGPAKPGAPSDIARVTLTVSNGQLVIDNAVLANFSLDNRLSLTVSGLSGGQTVNLGVLTEIEQAIDPTQTLTFSRSITVTPGVLALQVTPGRATSYHIDAATATGGTPTYNVSIVPSLGVSSVNLTGISNAFATSTGAIVLLNRVADANGNVVIPQSLLNQLGTQDVVISIIGTNLLAGSTFAVTATYNPAVALPEGVLVETFDAAGNLVSGPEPRADAALPAEIDPGTVGISALPGGGFAAHWVIAGPDDDGVGIALQRYNADGTKQGSVVELTGLPSVEGGESGFDFAALANGGYALSYGIALEDFYHEVTLSSSTPNRSFSVPITGEVSFISVATLGVIAPSPTFSLVGFGLNGQRLVVPLTLANGGLAITPEILAQFSIDNRFALSIGGVDAGESYKISFETLADQVILPDAPLFETTRSVTVAAGVGGGPTVGQITPPTGRVESFHVDAITTVPGVAPTYMLHIAAIDGGQGLNLAGIPNASYLPTGLVQIIVQPDANGDIDVPPALLSQLGTADAAITLYAFGLAAGSSFSATATVRAGADAQEGVFVLTFDADGHVLSPGLELVGTNGDDVLVGDVGDDSLSALGGANVLTGGAGEDTFHFASILGSNAITDFTSGEDVLDVSAIDADTTNAAGTEDAFAWGGSNPTAHGLWVGVSGADSVIYGDTDGNAATAELVIMLIGTPPPVQQDFIA